MFQVQLQSLIAQAEVAKGAAGRSAAGREGRKGSAHGERRRRTLDLAR